MDFESIRNLYKEQLTTSVLPFWLNHGLDSTYGGIYTALDEDGSLLDTDKSVWFQGRALWTYSTAYIEVEQRKEYVDASHNLVSFIDNYCYDEEDGRMFFRVSKDGKGIIKRERYVFSETFAVIGYSAYSRASGNIEYAHKAFELFKKIIHTLHTPNILKSKVSEKHRPTKGFGVPMILINTAQELRKALPEQSEYLNSMIDSFIHEIEESFVRDEYEAVIEIASINNEVYTEHIDGRTLNPGHAIEGAWFILEEYQQRNIDSYKTLGLKMLDWMFKKGWDTQYGGITYFIDLLEKSVSEYWHDMKFWWPQNEAAIANLFAYTLTREEIYKENFLLVHNYTQKHFIDHTHKEWYGYLHKDNSLSTRLKGNMFKGPFHIPRMYLKCLSLFDQIL